MPPIASTKKVTSANTPTIGIKSNNVCMITVPATTHGSETVGCFVNILARYEPLTIPASTNPSMNMIVTTAAESMPSNTPKTVAMSTIETMGPSKSKPTPNKAFLSGAACMRAMRMISSFLNNKYKERVVNKVINTGINDARLNFSVPTVLLTYSV